MLKRFIPVLLTMATLLIFSGYAYVAAAENEPEASPAFETIQPYTTGSNQEWALELLAQMENSEEAIRFYEFLLRAHTYLMVYDTHDYIEEYYFVKNLWLNAMPNFDEEVQADLRNMIDDENWTIDIRYPVDRPFRLTWEDFIFISLHFSRANPQFFLAQIIPAGLTTNHGFIPAISIPAYYAFAERRQEVYQNILYTFDNFKAQMEQAININSQVEILEYVFSYVNKTLTYNFEPEAHPTRMQQEALSTVVGFFGDYNVSWFSGYSAIFMYILNRLDIPTVSTIFETYIYNQQGERIDLFHPVWNIAKLDSGWYFIDSLGAAPLSEIFIPCTTP